ncbi:MAG TPA: LysE family translocator [Candidatus Pelagibacter sp.]|jgi:threonine/homoserine/homoserine lactone efflux protein|nr:LysE family translocator [Candidatus Pelagibacter sp.]
MFPNNYILFLQIILFLFITPGTPRIVIVSQAINYGVKKCIWIALGDISANTLQMILVVFVIGEFFSTTPQILNILKWFSVIYLFYLAYDIYSSKISNISKEKSYSKSIFSFYKDGFLVAGTSPKAWIFFPLIFPQFLDFNSNYYVQFLILMFTYISLDFLSLMAYAVAADKMVKWLKTNPRTINTISACSLIIIALIITVTQNY